VQSIKKKIKKEHPEIQAVGLIKNWQESKKYSALDIVFYDGRRLLLTYIRAGSNPTFSVERIGEYSFQTYLSNGYGGRRIFVRILEEVLGKSSISIYDTIDLYDEIYEFTLSLPDLNAEDVRTEQEKLMIQAEIWYQWPWLSDVEFKRIKGNSGIDYIIFRDYWDDRSYGKSKPIY
jgi:hypothetical protein